MPCKVAYAMQGASTSEAPANQEIGEKGFDEHATIRGTLLIFNT